ncbi:MAG: type II toxin-antitoxin system RatA family toxin [Proteobacteria bacterium]|nr:type II toxin-antitoxin system RatA family toxin [Pseudomonadota bacterium]
MPIVKKSALVLHSANCVYDLVNGVDCYPDFLPWCCSTTIEEQSETHMVAEIVIGYRGINKSFKTKNQIVKPTETASGTIEICLVEGPFKNLHGIWSFTPLESHGCRIEFEVQYEFSNALVSKIVGPVFNQIAETLLDSFVRRAEKLYA